MESILQSLGLEALLPVFIENAIDEDSMKLLGETELREPLIGPRLKLKKIIDGLKQQEVFNEDITRSTSISSVSEASVEVDTPVTNLTTQTNENSNTVVEGGVTRRVARAMEVLNASGPGARVRVMRAAYHESAGSGSPATSYLMHASRRVISSGFNLLEPPMFPSKPLEISSTPFESSQGENYKVTEPDDLEISEPSKWRSSTGDSTVRMPSEESSSTDNASIIDLDARHKNILRKYSYDSENSDIPTYRRNSSRLSPLLDSPVALSTLKYKSLLNGSSDWNNRRKSYSFEDTSPINETIIHNNDTLAMESSTDSGICKSTEVVNEPDDKSFERKEIKHDKHEETFKDWLSKNRLRSSFTRGSHKPYREHGVVVEESPEHAIALQSRGKVSITVPMTVADDYQYRKQKTIDDADRRTKRVEFCKTELHFAAETGKVNIIATDEKPPPSNDFRKRRSAFVPMHGAFDKPITLFGETTKEFSEMSTSEFNNTTNETCEFDESTAATKSILKNKIPKPKPYLLGENMSFGTTSDSVNNLEESIYDTPVSTAVSLINRQLQSERRHSEDKSSSFTTKTTPGAINRPIRTVNTSPLPIDSLKLRKKAFEVDEKTTISNQQKTNTNSSVQKFVQMSPVENSAKTRQLRDSDLTYFGVLNELQNINQDKSKCSSKSRSASSSIDDLFQSVRLIQRVSNSVGNSEAESDDTPEYQNIPIKTNFTPIPTPRTRSKYDISSAKINEARMLRPVIESKREININVSDTRQSRLRQQEETKHASCRSISEPPKSKCSIDQPRRRPEHTRSSKNNASADRALQNNRVLTVKKHPNIDITEEEEPTYVNLGERKLDPVLNRTESIRRRTEKLLSKTNISTKSKKENDEVNLRTRNQDYSKEDKDKINKKILRKHSTEIEQDSLERKSVRKIRTEKLATPEFSNDKYASNKSNENNSRKTALKSSDVEGSILRSFSNDHRSRSSQRPSQTCTVQLENANKSVEKVDLKQKEASDSDHVKYHTRTSSKDKSGKRENSKTRQASEMYCSGSQQNTVRKKETSTSERTKSDNYKSSKRSEYVINYDDKNGTVSSVCKVMPSANSSKKTTKEKIIENPKEYKKINKASEEKYLLQSPEHQCNPYEMNYVDRKWKRKMLVQRSCQLL